MQGVYTKKVSVLPRAITPGSFSDRIQAVDNVTSAAMYAALQGAHLLDLKDMLVQDPRRAAPIHLESKLCTCRPRSRNTEWSHKTNECTTLIGSQSANVLRAHSRPAPCTRPAAMHHAICS